MKTGLYQGTALKQEMKINPRLYQAMDLLYMPLLDLQQHLKQELLNNPFLEMVEPEEEDDEDVAEARRDGGAKRGRRTRSIGRRSSSNGFETGGRREEHEEKRILRAGFGGHARPERPPARPDRAAAPLRSRAVARPRSSSATSATRATSSARVERRHAFAERLASRRAAATGAPSRRTCSPT